MLDSQGLQLSSRAEGKAAEHIARDCILLGAKDFASDGADYGDDIARAQESIPRGRAMTINFTVKARVASRAGASAYLKQPGDAVIVDRQGPRWLIMSC